MISPLNRLHMTRIVVAVDPAVTSTEESDMTGIIVAGTARDGEGYVLDDLTCRLSPDGWATRVAYGFHKWGADRVIAEANNGGDLLSTVLRTVDPGLPVKLVHASRGKLTRAEPVAALYEQGKVHHVGMFPELEDQLCVAAGTRVLTLRGNIPIESVRVGDQALTRAGWRPVTWAGQTGTASEMVEITAEDGRCLRCTPSHPVWVDGLGFRPAAEVQSGHRCQSQSSANTSNIEASNTSVPSSHPVRNIGGQHASSSTAASQCCCTGCCTKRLTDRFRMAGMSTTGMRTDSTTISATLWHSVRPATLASMVHTDRADSDLLRMNSAANGDAKRGLPRRHIRSSACPAVRSSSARVSEPCSAPSSVVAATTRASATTEPVYNLTVADQPEFFANGLLVHNCTWIPGAEKSPDRLDALVWALSELMVTGGGMGAPVFTLKPGGSRHKIQ